ncbi:MAG TPA: hypothetical protein VNS19_12505 [Acidimicrobiales bacterium]|nr:hypothetical protein [Acidimicrobiales bacterium]
MVSAATHLLAQASAPADPSGSNAAVLIVGVLVVTAVIVVVVIRRSKR